MISVDVEQEIQMVHVGCGSVPVQSNPTGTSWPENVASC